MQVILVHGAWCDASSWSEVVLRLQRAGHEVTGVQLGLTSLASDVDITRREIAAVAGPVCLVGHSYGGAVISGAGESQVTQLVYVAAYAPDSGEDVLSLGATFPPSAGGGAIRPDDQGYLRLDRGRFPEVFAADVELERAAVLAAVQQPTHASCFGSPLESEPAWRGRPSLYIRSTRDQMIHPDGQAQMAQRMGARLVDVDSSHASPIAHPGAVSEAILSVL